MRSLSKLAVSAALFIATSPLLVAQQQIATLDLVSTSSPAESLPDAPSTTLSSIAAQQDHPSASPAAPAAGKYDRLILPGQYVDKLTGGEKILYSMKEQFSLIQLPAIIGSAALSHGLDSAPHYGTNSTAFAQRVGAAAARQTVQTLATDGLFAAAFHDDPRYYVMGPSQPAFKRFLYAASRVLVTRSDEGKARFNAPLFAGYATAAAVNNAYYPERDRKASTAASSYAASLAGAAVGFEIREFVEDALDLFRHKH